MNNGSGPHVLAQLLQWETMNHIVEALLNNRRPTVQHPKVLVHLHDVQNPRKFSIYPTRQWDRGSGIFCQQRESTQRVLRSKEDEDVPAIRIPNVLPII